MQLDSEGTREKWKKLVSPYFRKVWNKLSPSSNQILYHYTTGVNLIQIVESGELWATQVSCLNDIRECQSYFHLLKEAIKAPEAKTRASGRPNRIVRMLSELPPELIADRLPELPTFVACFATNRDDLSQWRAYSGGDEGYAIGIDMREASAVYDDQQVSLVRVVYALDEQKRLVNDICDCMAECLQEQPIFSWLDQPIDGNWGEADVRNYQEAGIAALALLQAVEAFAPCFKNNAYRSENEWRLIYRSDGEDQRRMRFRQRRGFLARHVALFGSESHGGSSRLPSLLREVVIGPCAYPKVSLVNVRALLDAKQCSRNVVQSSIPYRSV